MRRPRSIAKLAAVIVLALSGFALAGVMASSGLATDPTTSGTDTGTTSTGTTSTGTTDTGTTSTGTTETQPPGGGGCTPGYWKNHTEDWVGYTPGQTGRERVRERRQPRLDDAAAGVEERRR